jgi:hypothetical protein
VPGHHEIGDAPHCDGATTRAGAPTSATDIVKTACRAHDAAAMPWQERDSGIHFFPSTQKPTARGTTRSDAVAVIEGSLETEVDTDIVASIDVDGETEEVLVRNEADAEEDCETRTEIVMVADAAVDDRAEDEAETEEEDASDACADDDAETDDETDEEEEAEAAAVCDAEFGVVADCVADRHAVGDCDAALRDAVTVDVITPNDTRTTLPVPASATRR